MSFLSAMHTDVKARHVVPGIQEGSPEGKRHRREHRVVDGRTPRCGYLPVCECEAMFAVGDWEMREERACMQAIDATYLSPALMAATLGPVEKATSCNNSESVVGCHGLYYGSRRYLALRDMTLS